ncbi:hypothetical protein K505DRAFT_320648 [Melanomma pulvis-pyrius CBS 109.77]|uniref:Reverse transcriptase domain-containing protein n=1 Tax=Melanomma pulvis-pyrius CBS 109.77 TaxID=1314802 RepID=A0A6A6XU94_9PLEO|nr:hypothetical protein K505DRAFT_320648 [Melanomma pulvis-pyrius CBS 109.77]
MNTSVRPVIGQVLKDAVELKIEEFERATANFKRRYDGACLGITGEDDTLKRLTTLLEQIKTLDPYLEDDGDLETMTRFVEQAKDDRSVSQASLQKFEKQLLDKLALYYHRLDVSHLHNSLIREALYSGESVASASADLEKTTLEDEFDMVEGELETAFQKFETSSFNPNDVDSEKLETYLKNLFDGAGTRGLERLREDFEEYGNELIDGHDELDEDTVEWSIKDLLQNGMLSEKQQQTLQGYLQSPVAIREFTSLLNVKSIRNWNYRNPEKGRPITARQNSEGKYCITIEEDVVDMIFLHSLATGWSTTLKEYLTDFVSNYSVWVRNKMLSTEESAKRDYYLLCPRPKPRPMPPPKASVCTLCHGPPPPRGGPPSPPRGPLGPPPPPILYPPPPPGRASKPRKSKWRYTPPPPPPPPFGGMSLNEERYRDYMQNFFLTRLPKRCGGDIETTPVNETQSKLMKLLATEAKLREAFDGEVHSLATNFNSFASSLPHKTILTMLKFIGVPQLWLEVFTRFLKAPLNMGPLVRGANDQLLVRTCGVPIAHSMELFLGELVLFFLDFAVHQKTGGYLYRLRDKCYFVGNAEQCKEAYETIALFSSVTSLDLSAEKSLAEEPIGFMNLGIQQGQPPAFSIDNEKIEVYARRVKKQLAACTTVLEWIRVWNTTMGKYASHLFGPLANVFGKTHLENVTQAYNKMHEIIFGSSNLTSHVTHLILRAKHVDFNNPIVLEPLIFLPTAYGGLGVKNPYTTLNLARTLVSDPGDKFSIFMSSEKSYYEKAAEVFKSFTAQTRADKQTYLSPQEQSSLTSLFTTRDPADFMSLEEYTRNREQVPYPFLAPKETFGSAFPFEPAAEFVGPPPMLTPLYTSLLEEPRDEITQSERVSDDVRKLNGKRNMKGWWSLSSEDRWVLQMYGDECLERYGSLEVWCGDDVPTEVLGMLRGEGNNDWDDASSYLSEV